MAEPTLLVGGPGSGKTDEVISRLAARYEADPFSEAIVLVPTVRHGDQFRRRLVGRCGVALGLRVETIGQFSRTLASDTRVPSHGLAEELLQRTLRAEVERGPAAYFKPVAGTRGLRSLLAGAVGDLLAEGVDPEALSQAARRSESRSLEALAAIYERYTSRLTQENWTHPLQIGAAAADVVRAGAALPGAILLDGFHLFRGTEMVLLEALAGKADVVVTLDPGAGDRAGHDYRRLRDRFPNAEVTELDRDAPPADPVAGAAADREAQLRAIARQIKQRLTDEPALRPSDFAIAFRQVPPHLGMARQVFSEYDLPLDPAAGEPLSARPLGAWLRRLMHLARDGWHLRDVVAVLSSGFVDLRRWQLSRSGVSAFARRRARTTSGRDSTLSGAPWTVCALTRTIRRKATRSASGCGGLHRVCRPPWRTCRRCWSGRPGRWPSTRAISTKRSSAPGPWWIPAPGRSPASTWSWTHCEASFAS